MPIWPARSLQPCPTAPSVGREKGYHEGPSGGGGRGDTNYPYRLSNESIGITSTLLIQLVIPKGFGSVPSASGAIHSGDQG